MSDYQQEELPVGGEADEPVSFDDEVAGGEAEPEFVEQEPEYDFLEVDDSLRQKYVRAKVDGEEVPVPFEDLINSYSRESVSTKRFQEASQMRQEADEAIRLAQALKVNPGLTVQYLAQQAGVSVQEYLGMSPAERAQATEDYSNDEDEYLDPLERQLRQQQQELQQMREEMQQRAADERLHNAVQGLKSQFQINDDQARAVVGRALEMRVGPEMFPVIYRAMAHEAAQQASAQHTATQEAERQRRQAAAQRAQQVVGATPSAVGTTTEQPAQTFTSIREATLAAMESLGME